METRVRDQLGGHASEWDRLVDAMPLPSPFLRSWWLTNVAVGEPRFVLVFDGETLLGGLALQRSVKAGVEWLQFLGAGPLEPDHLDLVAAPGRVAEVTAEVRRWLGRRGDRVIDLVGARAAAWVLDAVPGTGGVTPLEVAPYVPLPSTAEEYLATRPGRMRSTITRSAKRLAKAGVTLRVVGADAAPEEVDRSLAALSALHDGRWGDASGFLGAWDAFAAAARAGTALGEFRFHELVDADGEIVAIEADFAVDGRMSFYQAGRRTDHELRGSGSALRFDVITSAIESGCAEFDLLRGGEAYKADWAVDRRGLLRVRRGVGVRGRAIVAAARLNVAVQDARASRAAARGGAATDGGGPEASTPTGGRIVFYTDATQIGGAESVAKTLLAELDERFAVIVVGTDQTVVDDIARVRPQSATMVLPPINDRSDVAAMLAHRQAIRALRPDVFHANLSEGSSCQYALLAALSVPGVRVVVTENSPMGVRSELSRRIKHWSAPRFDAHIGVGVEAARLVEQDAGLAAGSVLVIPNAVPVVEHPEPAPRDPDVRSIVAVSRFDPVKGLDVLVEAVALLPANVRARARVVVYGDGPERERLRRCGRARRRRRRRARRLGGRRAVTARRLRPVRAAVAARGPPDVVARGDARRRRGRGNRRGQRERGAHRRCVGMDRAARGSGGAGGGHRRGADERRGPRRRRRSRSAGRARPVLERHQRRGLRGGVRPGARGAAASGRVQDSPEGADRSSMSTATSPLWLSHHDADGLDRCVVVGGRHVCRRCAVLYPLAVAVAVAQVAGAIPATVGVWVMWLAPVGVVAEWVAEHLAGVGYRPARQVVLTAIAAPSLGIALGRHARHPFEAAAVAPMLVFASVCLVVWFVGAQRRSAGDQGLDWELEFERSEADRLGRLTELALGQPGSATKSMSSSTAPTSDGLRSL
ncbi:MAG: GNAT family N-acetyltransferase [Acidimicrobiales bacterium]